MKIRVQLILESADGSEPETITEEIGCFSRSDEGHDLLGLSLAESKELLSALQKQLTAQQIAIQMWSFSHCNACGQPHRRNGQQAYGEEATDALDPEGCSLTASGPRQNAERGYSEPV